MYIASTCDLAGLHCTCIFGRRKKLVLLFAFLTPISNTGMTVSTENLSESLAYPAAL